MLRDVWLFVGMDNENCWSAFHLLYKYSRNCSSYVVCFFRSDVSHSVPTVVAISFAWWRNTLVQQTWILTNQQWEWRWRWGWLHYWFVWPISKFRRQSNWIHLSSRCYWSRHCCRLSIEGIQRTRKHWKHHWNSIHQYCSHQRSCFDSIELYYRILSCQT